MAFRHDLVRGFAKKKNSENLGLLWKLVGGSRCHSEFFLGKSSQIALKAKPVLIFWSSIPCVFCLYNNMQMLLKVVGYYNYDLNVLSMSVMVSKKQKVWMGFEYYPIFLGFFGIV